jgi:undecaprenyl-phosphate galactose phosphotransferase
MEQIFLLRIKSNLLNLSHKFLKRLFDIIFSLLLIPFFLPIMIIIGILIKLDSRGPIFFIQERVGIFGKRFRVFKFRTMYLDADFRLDSYLKDNPSAREEWDKYKKLRGFDPRVTRVGKIIRQLSLDELPQIFNVLLGDMSFVGPRPYLEAELKRYENYAKIILMIPPGITGLWQTSGRNELSFEERLRLDTWYVLNWTLWLDIVILLKTMKVILTREGAY